MVARISDLVGAAFFFAIFNLLLVYAYAGFHSPLFQLGAENNIEKSRCLAQARKKNGSRCARGLGFSRLARRVCA
jgi:hypothetical protein